MDTATSKRIALLHPSVREEVTKIIQECDVALTGRAKVRITQGLRTFKEQDDLYAIGRTKPGKKSYQCKSRKIHSQLRICRRYLYDHRRKRSLLGS